MPRTKAAVWTVVPGWLVAILLWIGALNLFAVEFPLRWRWSNPAPHGNNIIGMAYLPAPAQLGVQVTERGQIYTSDDLIFWIPRESGTTSNLRSVAFLGSRIVVVGENGAVLYANNVNDFQAGTLIDGPTADWLEGVATSPTLAVAVGDNGAIYTSSDGISWKRRVTIHTDWFKSIAWGNGVFIAVGDGGAVLTSPNGTNWTRRTSGTMQNLSRIAFGTVRFTAVGAGGVALGRGGSVPVVLIRSPFGHLARVATDKEWYGSKGGCLSRSPPSVLPTFSCR